MAVAFGPEAELDAVLAALVRSHPPSISQDEVEAEAARVRAGRVIDRALEDADATDEEKAERQDRLTALPQVVKKTRGKAPK